MVTWQEQAVTDEVRNKRSHLVGPPFPALTARFQLQQIGIFQET